MRNSYILLKLPNSYFSSFRHVVSRNPVVCSPGFRLKNCRNDGCPVYPINNPKPVAGFTMIEMVMTIVILSIMAGLTAPLFSQGIGAAQTTVQNLQTIEKLRYATERIVREIRHINFNSGTTAYDIATMTTSNLVFTKNDASSTVVTITDASPLLTMGYSTPAVANVTLTDEVMTMGFVYFDSTGSSAGVTNANVAAIEITLSLQNPSTGGIGRQRTRIALRDKS